MAFFSVIVMTAEQRKNMMNENILNEIESDCFHTILTENQVAALAADGSIFGSGLAINDLMLKPNISASGALAVFDNKGNLIQTGLNNISLLNVSDLITNDQNPLLVKVQKDGIIRFTNGLQFCWGMNSQIININEQMGNSGIYRNNGVIDPIGFSHSFSNIPVVTMSIKTSSSVWLGGIRASKGGITSFRVLYPGLVENITIEICWTAVGEWKE